MASRPYIDRAPRFLKALQIKGSTFGCKDPYDLMAINISYSGLLVGSLATLPFQLRTLLELDIGLVWEGAPQQIQCLAKVVRSVKGDSQALAEYNSSFDDQQEKFSSVYGMQIREISDNGLRLWKKFIDSIETIP